MSWWYVFWAVWILSGLVAEFSTVYQRDFEHTLTGFMRRMLLDHPYGTAIVSAFLVWLVFHWIYDDKDLGWTDLTAVCTGIFVGIGGWLYRQRKKLR